MEAGGDKNPSPRLISQPEYGPALTNFKYLIANVAMI